MWVWPECGAQSERIAPALESAVQLTSACASKTHATQKRGCRLSRLAVLDRSPGRKIPPVPSHLPRAASASARSTVNGR